MYIIDRLENERLLLLFVKYLCTRDLWYPILQFLVQFKIMFVLKNFEQILIIPLDLNIFSLFFFPHILIDATFNSRLFDTVFDTIEQKFENEK